ncbi:MAG: hypothetical protein KDA78_09525 [Planctomycetaceae bacterium]|nr:hypothetical protein [Planctomycetaceae bacterium]
MSEASTPSTKSEKTGHHDEVPKSIYLVSYPKIVFMYPTVIASLIVAVWMHFSHGLYEVQEIGKTSVLLGTLFLAIFSLNLVVISFDFPRTTSLTLFFFIAAFGLGGYVLLVNFPNMLPFLSKMLSGIRPVANAQFYYLLFGVFVVMFLLVKVGVQLDYWEVRPNELLHHHGFLSDLERFSAPNLRIDKEINDLFEFMLLGSGRLILHPSNERRAIVLENVFFIGTKEKSITKMLGALQVQVRDDSN